MYIVTALHVIAGNNEDKRKWAFNALKGKNKRYKILIKTYKNSTLPCEFIKHDVEMDLAVLKVVCSSCKNIGLKLSLKEGKAKKAKNPDQIYFMAPVKDNWEYSTGNITKNDSEHIFFKASDSRVIVQEGTSGGVLLDKNYRAIGLIQSTGNENQALRIDRIIEQLKDKEWNIPAQINQTWLEDNHCWVAPLMIAATAVVGEKYIWNDSNGGVDTPPADTWPYPPGRP